MRKQQQHVATLRMQAQNPSSSSNPAVGDSQPAINSSPVSTSSALRSRTAEGEVVAPPQLPISSEGQAMARQAWEYVEEIVQILKTAFPLLVLSLETIVDQLSKRFRSTTEEEVYRNVGLLLLDAVQARLSLYWCLAIIDVFSRLTTFV
jgi:transformation/transcription domain-associated protein